MYSDNKSLIFCGNNVELKCNNSKFECASDRFIFSKSTNALIECNNNINLYSYDILTQSDFTLQTNILNTDVNAVEILNQIPLMKFDRIENSVHEDIGIIAQNIQSILPNIIYTDSSTGMLSIKMSKFIPYLIKAVQELYTLITAEPEETQSVE